MVGEKIYSKIGFVELDCLVTGMDMMLNLIHSRYHILPGVSCKVANNRSLAMMHAKVDNFL